MINLKEALTRASFWGCVFVLGGSLVLLADYWNFPAPGVVQDWLGSATVALVLGLAIVFISIGKAGWEVHKARREERQEDQRVLYILATLDPDECERLLRALEAPTPRLQYDRSKDRVADNLTTLSVFRLIKGVGRSRRICEVHPTYWRRRHELIRKLKERETEASRPARR
jgi:hypothetical protein